MRSRIIHNYIGTFIFPNCGLRMHFELAVHFSLLIQNTNEIQRLFSDRERLKYF